MIIDLGFLSVSIASSVLLEYLWFTKSNFNTFESGCIFSSLENVF